MAAPTAAPGDGPLLYWRLSGFYATYFLTIGIYMPFWPLWLDGRGLSPSEIGWVLAGAFWIKVAAQPGVARIADWTGHTRGLTAGLMFAAAATFAMLSGGTGFWPLLALNMLAAVFFQPVLPVMESVVLGHAGARGLDYGRIRLWGSVAFIAATAGFGWWIDGRAIGIVVWVLAACMVLVGLSCLAAPNRIGGPARSRGGAPVRGLFSRPFVLFLITMGLLNSSHGVLNGFASLHWRALGHGEALIGLFWSVGVVAEIAVFLGAGRYRHRLSALVLIALAAAAGVLRWPLLAVAEDAAPILALQVLHGLTFGAGHLGAMTYLSRAFPADLAATGQSLYYAIVGGVLAGVMFPVSGHLFATMGADAFLAMGVLSAGALVCVALLRRQQRGPAGT